MGEVTDKPKARAFRVTSFDVAAEAGVSQSTVSRALAGDPVVSEATRARVAAAAAKLNYSVDENAARLRTGRTGTIAVVVICRHDEDRKDLNPFTYALLGTICAAASARGFETLVSFQDEPGRRLGLVYLYKRGTFYPFAPLEKERRDNALELQVRAAVGADLKIESDLGRWFAVWGAPGL